jgi:alkanesulfonate monooxygenase SsuD/methylene tetrahydromethanopterin reductase-like flavin-dependent oxidoreductase (luciferase family)
LAKAIAASDRISGGRIDLGLGAGWYGPDYDAVGMTMPRPGERIDRLDEYVSVVTAMLHHRAPVTFAGRHHSVAGAVNDPPPRQDRLPVFVGGRGDRLLGLVARHGVGWNTCWALTTDAYRARVAVLDRACERHGRSRADIWQSIGLYALCGENERDLQQRFDRMVAATPAGVLDGMTLERWREGRLVGTVEQVREQAGEWADLGVETIIVGNGAVPFQMTDLDDIALLASALVER